MNFNKKFKIQKFNNNKYKELMDIILTKEQATFLKIQPYKKKLIIGFHINGICERGMELALWDYAIHNELNGNVSYIFYDKNAIQNKDVVIKKFNDKFINRVFSYNKFDEIIDMTKDINFDCIYFIKDGINDNKIINNLPCLVHCVFTTIQPHGDLYTVVSQDINKTFNTNYSWIPHMIDMPDCKKDNNFKKVLNIPDNALVIGRYGGFNQFNIDFIKDGIIQFLNNNNNNDVYFIFANTKPFISHPKVIYCKTIYSKINKAKFIQTCDAMIHARNDGETFGLSIGEFNIYNKPIITTYATVPVIVKSNFYSNAHIDLLGDKAIIVKDKNDVINTLNNIREIITSRDDWRGEYKNFTPNAVMKIFYENIHKTMHIKLKKN
jgi:hypothetical protein